MVGLNWSFAFFRWRWTCLTSHWPLIAVTVGWVEDDLLNPMHHMGLLLCLSESGERALAPRSWWAEGLCLTPVPTLQLDAFVVMPIGAFNCGLFLKSNGPWKQFSNGRIWFCYSSSGECFFCNVTESILLSNQNILTFWTIWNTNFVLVYPNVVVLIVNNMMILM